MSLGWEDRAEAWVAWARPEGHDAYWAYRDSFFDDLTPPPLTVLEVGCGEGRVCRDLVRRGYDVVGIDASPTLVAAAREAEPRAVYELAHAEALPYEDGSFGAVVTYNSLMDVESMPIAVAEMARVLRVGGRLSACVLHPVGDAGRFSDDSERFTIAGSYFDESEYELLSERNGLTFPFRCRRYTLSSYVSAFVEAGLRLDLVREPLPGKGSAGLDRWNRVPLFLHLHGVRA